jgi:SAM-dependent methyltransferase
MGSCSVGLLSQFAETACVHAWENHAIRISLSGDAKDVIHVDGILNAYRGAQNPSDDDHSELESLVLCYGAWLGAWIQNRWHGRWIGLNEVVAPRMVASGLIVSPLDAVRRRLTDTNAPDLQQLVVQLSEDFPNPLPANARALNGAAWDKRSTDPRFAYLEPWSMWPEQALEDLDPWIVAEGSIVDRRVLCLAAGGGTHGPLFALAGAEVVVVDFSLPLLQIDESIAQENELRIRTVHASMEDLSVLEPASFDCVVQPVSTCYVQNVDLVYRQVARVLRSGGLYVSQHKSPASLQAELRSSKDGIMLMGPCVSGRSANPVSDETVLREGDMCETIHSIEDLIGGLCRCGFVVEDVIEPTHADAWAAEGTPEHRALFVPPYLKIKARRR